MRLLQVALFVASALGVVAEEATKEEKPTNFEGVSVPPLQELSPTTWDAEVNKTKFMVVKHFR